MADGDGTGGAGWRGGRTVLARMDWASWSATGPGGVGWARAVRE